MWDPDLIEALRKAYNAEHSKSKDIPKGSPEKVWSTLKQRLQNECDSDKCIIKSLIRKPSAPMAWSASPSEWLSSDDIEKVEKNYMKIVPNYYFVGCVPIDFGKQSETGACLVDSLCAMDILSLYKKGYTMIGIVFNTDPHDQPGEHWISAFADLRDDHPYMSFFDSYGLKPETEVQELMSSWKDQWDSAGGPPMKLVYNDIRHQYKESECGMYCIYFIHCCIMRVPMNQRIPDDVMMTMRKFFFTIPKKRRHSS